jgi:hypothetical protein
MDSAELSAKISPQSLVCTQDERGRIDLNRSDIVTTDAIRLPHPPQKKLRA